jgi:hypothetical protein
MCGVNCFQNQVLEATLARSPLALIAMVTASSSMAKKCGAVVGVAATGEF